MHSIFQDYVYGSDFLPKDYYRDDSFEETDPDNSSKKHESEKSFVRSQLLILIQSVLCVIILAVMLILKAVGGSIYAQTATWYFDRYNDSVFTGTACVLPVIKEETVITETSRTSFDELKRTGEASGSEDKEENNTGKADE